MDDKKILSFDANELQKYEPNRYPFLFIDRVTECVPGEYAKGYKNLTNNEWFFPKHYVGHSIMPAAVQTEALRQMVTIAFTTLPGIENDDVFVFDSVGRGTVPVLARAGLDVLMNFKKNRPFAKRFALLFERTQNILREASPQKWMTLPVPYSDNAGFLACGIPAVAITMLPKEEASLYCLELMKDKNLEKTVMNAKLSENADFAFKYREKMPLTWRLFHTEYDNFLSLTPESFKIIEKILEKLLPLYV